MMAGPSRYSRGTVVVAGRVERVRWYRSLLAYELRPVC
jgi:hypothetical protein